MKYLWVWLSMLMSPTLGFQVTLLASLYVSLSSNSMVMFWVCLEFNMLSFLPLMSMEGDLALENTMKYFLIQSIASIFFLIGTIIMVFSPLYFMKLCIMLAVLMKLGASPLHGWFLSLMKNSSARIMFYLSTSQKFIPLMIMSNLNMGNGVLSTIILFTMLTVFASGVSTILLNKILSLSSINNLIWMLASSQISVTLMLVYFTLYMIMLLSVLTTAVKTKGSLVVSQTVSMTLSSKLMFSFFFMSLGGLPPFLGFLGKLLVLKNVIVYFNIFLLLMLTFSSLMVLMYYMMFSLFSLTFSPSSKITPGLQPTSLVYKGFVLSLLSFNVLALYAT